MKKQQKLTASRKYLLKRLWTYMSSYRLILITVIFLTIVSNVLNLIGPLLSGNAIDATELGIGQVDFPKVFYYVKLMLIFYIVASVLNLILSRLLINLSRKVVYKMRQDVFNKLVKLPVSYFDTHQTGDIISRITYDIDTINTSLTSDLMQMITSVISISISLVMMLIISPILVLIFAITIPISIFIASTLAKKVRPLFRKRSKKLGELNGYIEEVSAGFKTIKAYNQEETFITNFDIKNKEAVDAAYNADYIGSIMGPSVGFMNNISLSLVSVFGALLYMNGTIATIGKVSSFVLYSRRFSGPINEFANIVSELQSAFAAAERVFRLIDEKEENPDILNAYVFDNVKGEVTLDSVNFGYVEDSPIIKDLNLVAKPGSTIAIVGPTGAGKTTIVNLLMRFYDVNSGEIRVDNHAIKDATRSSVRGSYTMVLQDTWLFYGTIFENIAYGKDDATLEEVTKVAKAAKIHNFIISLPNGYDTILSDNAVNISKGQKQLLTIARAMLMDSNMLILDEATSNVDTQTERQIQSAMLKLMENKTSFVIAHRLSTIKSADEIIVVKDGRIIEKGSHNELILEKGFYHELYLSQQNEY